MPINDPRAEPPWFNGYAYPSYWERYNDALAREVARREGVAKGFEWMTEGDLMRQVWGIGSGGGTG